MTEHSGEYRQVQEPAGATVSVGTCMSAPAEDMLVVGDTLQAAEALMWRHGVRYLPVLENGRLVGLLSERDLSLAKRLRPHDWQSVSVVDTMTGVPYCTVADAPLDEVADELSLRASEVALVLSGSRIAGLFTCVEAYTLLACILRAGGLPDQCGRGT